MIFENSTFKPRICSVEREKNEEKKTRPYDARSSGKKMPIKRRKRRGKYTGTLGLEKKKKTKKKKREKVKDVRRYYLCPPCRAAPRGNRRGTPRWALRVLIWIERDYAGTPCREQPFCIKMSIKEVRDGDCPLRERGARPYVRSSLIFSSNLTRNWDRNITWPSRAAPSYVRRKSAGFSNRPFGDGSLLLDSRLIFSNYLLRGWNITENHNDNDNRDKS